MKVSNSAIRPRRSPSCPCNAREATAARSALSRARPGTARRAAGACLSTSTSRACRLTGTSGVPVSMAQNWRRSRGQCLLILDCLADVVGHNVDLGRGLTPAHGDVPELSAPTISKEVCPVAGGPLAAVDRSFT